MKRYLFPAFFSLLSSLSAAPFDDAAALLQSRKYPEAAAAFAALPPTASAEPGQVFYLQSLSLHLAGKQDEAAAAADKVPADSPWGLKGRFLKAAALTAAKKHRDAEAIYAAEAVKAFSPQRRDALVTALLAVADEASNPVAAGELEPPKPDWKKASGLCEKVLDMPITPELRSDVLFKKAGLLQKSGDFNAAHAAWNAWLLLFDPEWTVPFTGGKVPDRSAIKYIGKGREEARLRLTECLLAAGRPGEARLCARDLMTLLAKPADVQNNSPAAQWPGDAAWLYVRTFAPRQGGQPRQQLQMRDAQQFNNSILPAPQQQQAVPLPGPQGDVASRGPVGSPFEQFANAVPLPKLVPDPVFTAEDYLRELRAFFKDYAAHRSAPEASEAIARTLEDEGRDAEAIAAWNEFIAGKNFQFDANADASRVQDSRTGLTPAESLLRRQQSAMFRIGQIHSDHRRYAEAIGQWQKYITAHPNGKEWQQAQSGIVEAEFQSGLTAVAAGDEKKAREIFDAFLARYPLDGRARQILFIYGQFRYAAGLAQKNRPTDKSMPEFQRAMDEWARLIGKYPNSEESSLALYNTALILTDELNRLEEGLAAFKRITWGRWAAPAAQRVKLMSSRSLAVASERVFRLAETPAVKVSLRNIEKVKVSRYPLDVEAFFRSRHRMDAIDLLDIDLIAPDKVWEVAVKDYARYKSIQQEIPVEFPAGKSGAYIVRVEAEDWQATTLLVRSDIDVLVESARREVLTYVMSGPDKKPVANAAVLLSDGSRIIASGQTGPDGVFRARPEGIEKAAAVRAFVSTPQGMAGSALDINGLAASTAPERMSRVFFHRSSYTPGSTVYWQALRREVKDGTFPAVPAGDGWKWRVQLPDGKLLYEGPATWTALGLCGGSFTLPPSSPAGGEGSFYRVTVFNGKETVGGRFYVSDPAGDGPANTVDEGSIERSQYLTGEKVRGSFRLAWSNGLPRGGEERTIIFPGGKSAKVKADENGIVPFEVDTAGLSDGVHHVSLNPAGDGTAVVFQLSSREFSLAFGRLPESVMAGTAFDVKAITQKFDATAIGADVKLTVLQREPAAPSHVLEGVPWVQFARETPPDVTVSAVDFKTGDKGEAVQQISLPKPGNYVLKLSGRDSRGNEISLETPLRATGGDDDSKLRLVAPNDPLIAGQNLTLQLQSGIAHPAVLVTVHAQEFFSHRLIPVQAGANSLEIPVLPVYAPNFRVTVAAMDGRTVHLTSRPFEVRSGLKVSVSAEPDGYSVRTTDLSGKPVAAQLLAAVTPGGNGAPNRAAAATVVPLRATGLSIESSAAFSHTGISLSKSGDRFVRVQNDQMELCAIQEAEISFNSSNSLLLDNNRSFMFGNTFLAKPDTRKSGVFVINQGIAGTKMDALGLDVKLSTSGVPDISWTVHEPSPAGRRATGGGVSDAEGPVSFEQMDTGAAGLVKKGGLDLKGGLTVAAYAVDGTSLVAADVITIPSAARVWLRPVLPGTVAPGQKFQLPLIVKNLTEQPVEATAATVRIGSESLQVNVPALAAGATAVVWQEVTCPAKWEEKDGAAAGQGARALPNGYTALPVSVSAAGAEWTGSLISRSVNIVSVLPAGGLYAQGEHTLTLPVAEGVTGYRLLTAPDLASLPVAPLNAAGESIDRSEPQNTASEMLHLLSALPAAGDAAKAGIRERLALLAAEIAATESDGGWAWENIDSSPGLLTTAFTWRTLLEARAAGVVLSDLMLKRTAAFVAGRYAGIGATDFERKGTTLQAMAAAGKADFSLLNPLYRSRESLSPVALSRLCAAFIYAGRTEEANEVLTQLLKTGTAGKTPSGEDTLFWPGSKGVAGLNAPEESTAAALWCVAKLNAAAPEARRIALWLLNSQATAPGGTTRCRGQVMQALSEYARSIPRAAAGDTVEVLSGGQAVKAQPGTLLPLPADGKLTIRVKGAAAAVVIVAPVRETAPDDPKTWEYPRIAGRPMLHDNFLLGERRLDVESTSPVAQAAYGQLVRVVVKIGNHPDPTWRSHGNFLQVEEEIPAGCLLLEGTLKHNADKMERYGNRIRFRYGPGTMQDISYSVIALIPGVWQMRAAELADPYDPSRCRRGPVTSLTILPPGTPSPDPYQMNRAEHLELARILFEQKMGAECLTHLDALAAGRLSQDEERDIARMRLWILAEKEDGDARTLIGAFELLTERHPQLVIPFEKLLRVGAAYRRLNEFERAATIFRAALDGAFLQDSSLGAAMEDAGDFRGSMELQEQLWRSFPDSKDVRDSLAGLAQTLSSRAGGAETIAVRRGQPKLEKNALLTRSRDLLQRYMLLYPGDAQTDDAAFSLVNVYFSLKDYAGMVSSATSGAERYGDSSFADSFKYMAALGWFWQGQFDKALAAAAPVANGESKDRDYARYVTAQVYHAQGKPAEAIEWYEKVKATYGDAAEAIRWYEEKKVSLPEVSIFKPGEPVKVTLDYRNIKEGAVQLYKVDLMKLYLREKSLSNITRVNLAGIAPQAGESFQLGDGKDYAGRKKELTLPVKEEGAYLAIVRGDNLFTSGLVLISPLKLEVKESQAGSVRVNVSDAATGSALADAEVKALGSQSQVVQSGATDPRGVFEAGGIFGTTTIIVKQGENRYAFHRGTRSIGSAQPPQIPQTFGGGGNAFPADAAAPGKVLEKGAYLKNVDESNKALQQQQINTWDTKRRGNDKGVQAGEALKK